MRISLVLVLMSLSFPALASTTPADTFRPTDECHTLGATHMSEDRTGLVVCALNNTGHTEAEVNCDTTEGGCSWKSMSSGDGGASYTVYGGTTCAPGWSVAYTGQIVDPFMTDSGGNAVGSVFCFQGSIEPWGVLVDNHFTALSNFQKYVEYNSIFCAVCVK
ncbi:MAG: hypothetical protein PHY92_08990 [Alphaproteobacteria bacterium]|nr:hypothetical protein [Alphaproteobacteria bacterium]